MNVIPNGVDPEHFKPLPRNRRLAESLNLITIGQKHESWRVIGFAGELREKKGLHPLLSTYSQVNRGKQTSLLIVGDVRVGEERQTFEAFKRSNPSARVIVTGFVSPADLPAYYSLMDVFVHPSLRDGLPNASLEAMAREEAIIATSAGGIKDAIVDCENRRLSSTNDVEDMASAINELLADEELRNKLSRASRQTIMKQFTLQAELDGNLAVYRQLGLKV